MTTDPDFLIVGAGMAGASLGAVLAASARVLVIEAEGAPGYHATGRSVAFWNESYGGPAVQPLTSASGPLLADASGWLDGDAGSFLSPRGALHVGTEADRGAAEALIAEFSDTGVAFDRWSPSAMKQQLPGLRSDWTVGLWEGSCADIDVAGLHGACLSAVRQRGSTVRCDMRLQSAHREGNGWIVETSEGTVRCGQIVNAAGAWADDVAVRCSVAPIGIAPLRRTVVQLRLAEMPDDLPLVVGLDGSFYFKPAGDRRIWLSPHDEIPDDPGDVAPEELDVAIAIARFEEVVNWKIEAVERRWAGLRSFAPDRLPVFGQDPLVRGFSWFAGQGGFGIQTAPAAALLAAKLITGNAAHPAIAAIDGAAYSPDRFGL